MNADNAPVKLTRRQEVWKFFQFLFFSLSAGVIEVLLCNLLDGVVHLPYWLAYLVALIASVLWNFTVNRKFTFKSVSNVPIAMLKVVAYYLVFAPLSTWWSKALSELQPGINDALWKNIILVGTMVVNFVTEFCVYRFWVFRTSINTSEAGKREQERVQGISIEGE